MAGPLQAGALAWLGHWYGRAAQPGQPNTARRCYVRALELDPQQVGGRGRRLRGSGAAPYVHAAPAAPVPTLELLALRSLPFSHSPPPASPPRLQPEAGPALVGLLMAAGRRDAALALCQQLGARAPPPPPPAAAPVPVYFAFPGTLLSALAPAGGPAGAGGGPGKAGWALRCAARLLSEGGRFEEAVADYQVGRGGGAGMGAGLALAG